MLLVRHISNYNYYQIPYSKQFQYRVIILMQNIVRPVAIHRAITLQLKPTILIINFWCCLYTKILIEINIKLPISTSH